MPQFWDVPTISIVKPPNYVEEDTRHIYPHLKHFLSLPSAFPFPAVHVKLEHGKMILTSRGHYWQIARELGKPRIRAFLGGEGSEPEASERPPEDVRRIPDEEIRGELEIPVVRGWHVYFFDGPLNDGEGDVFRERVCGFFEKLETPLLDKGVRRVFSCDFVCEFTCAQFEALIPVADKSWFKRYRDVSIDFSNHTHRIVSFQGAHFVP